MNESELKRDASLGEIARKFVKTIDGWVTISLMTSFFIAGVAVLVFGWRPLQMADAYDYGLASILYPILLAIVFVWQRAGVRSSQRFHFYTLVNVLVISFVPLIIKFGA